jgi:hypothetical protein
MGGALVTRAPQPLVREFAPRTLATLHVLVPVIVVAAWAVAIRGVHVAAMSDLGLVSVLPATVFVLLFVLNASFVAALFRPGRHWIVPLLHVLALIVILYAVTPLVEPEPRFSTAWKHVGIIDYVVRHGSVNPNLDAYFSWPGFFALGGLLTRTAGLHNAVSLTPWAPVAFNLLYLAPLLVIFRWATKDMRVVWLATWVFYCANWVGQDYFAPQALAFLMLLAMLCVLLPVFTPSPHDARGLLLRVLRKLHRTTQSAGSIPAAARVAWSPVQRAGLLVVVVALFAATVTGHQLTPFPALLIVTALVLFAGLETRGLPVLLGFILAAWISYMTTAYLRGNLQDLVGPFGNVSQNIDQNVGHRLRGSPDHDLIAHIRILASAGIWLFALLGLSRRLLAGRRDAAMVILGGTPFLLPALQPYGGEMLLRVYLFALPAVGYFAARLAFPTRSAGRSPLVAAMTLIALSFLLLSFQYTRYGNERVDNYSRGDVAAVRALYRIAPHGTTVVAGNWNLPWRYQAYEQYTYHELSDLETWENGAGGAAMLRDLRRTWGAHGAYVVLTRSNAIAEDLLYGRRGEVAKLVGALRRSPDAQLRYQGADGVVFYVRPPAPRAPAVAGTPGSAASG